MKSGVLHDKIRKADVGNQHRERGGGSRRAVRKRGRQVGLPALRRSWAVRPELLLLQRGVWRFRVYRQRQLKQLRPGQDVKRSA